MNEIFNPAPTEPVAVKSEAFGRKRFSNWTGSEVGPAMDDGSFYSNTAGLGQDTSSSGAFSWGYVGDWLRSAANVVTGIWGTSDKYVANAYQTMYNQERKNANILIFIVVALVLLAFAFLILKKK